MSENIDEKIASMEFEDAMNEMDKIISALESGRVSLKSAISCYAHGVKLYAHCKGLLDDAHAKASKIFINEDEEGKNQ